MRTSNDIILIHTFPKNLGHLDLKLVEGKRHRYIGGIGLWTLSHLWYSNIFLFSSLEGMRQRTPRNQCMFFLDVLKRLSQFEASSRNDAKELQLLCTQNLAQTLSSWFHSHFLLTLVQLSFCWSHGQILRQGRRDITRLIEQWDFGILGGQHFSQPCLHQKLLKQHPRSQSWNSRLLTVQHRVLCASKHCGKNAPFCAPFPKWHSG